MKPQDRFVPSERQEKIIKDPRLLKIYGGARAVKMGVERCLTTPPKNPSRWKLFLARIFGKAITDWDGQKIGYQMSGIFYLTEEPTPESEYLKKMRIIDPAVRERFLNGDWNV